MLLRESGKAMGDDVALGAAVGRGGDGGVAHGEALIRFAEAVTLGGDAVASARVTLLEAVGPAGFAEACSIVGIFNGLVRTADASGIPLDDGTLAASRDFRGELGLDQFPSSADSPANSPAEPTGAVVPDAGDVAKLFQ